MIETIVLLFLMINPLAVLVTFMNLTDALDRIERKQVAIESVTFASIVLVLATLCGKIFLDLMGIETYALQIAGGFLFLKFGWAIMSEDSSDSKLISSYIPLGFPVIAGPGSITAVILLSSKVQIIEVFVALLISLLLTVFLTFNSDKISSFFGESTTKSALKIMSLFIIAIGIQLIFSGLEYWFKNFVLTY